MNRLDRIAGGPWLGWLAALGLFLLSRPYQGVRHDGRLYVGDALAKLDPGGVGKDLIFAHDGQFGFSLYTPMLSRLIAALGLSGAALAIVAVTLILWFVAAVLLVERLLADRPPAVRWAALVFLVALPSLYGPMNVIGFAEPYQTPRGLAEAAGLVGMATYLSGRRLLGLLACVPGMLFHPIMGLCSAAVIVLAMCLEDRRWLWAGLAAVAVVAAAGLAHLPLAGRLFVVVDPAWRAVVEARGPILFPTLWPIESWSRLVAHACVLAAGAFVLTGAPRRLALGALIAGLVGVAAATILGDRFSLLLFLQVQTWRMLQPMAVLAAACLGLLAFELPRRGPAGLLGLALLAAGWMFRDIGDLSLAVAPVGLMFVLLGQRMRFSRPALVSVAAVGLLTVAALSYGALRSLALARTLARMPEAWPFSQDFVWSSDLPGLLIALAVGAGLARGWKGPPPGVRLATLAAIGLLSVFLWDDRPDFVRHRDQGRDPALVALTASRPGEILWQVGDVEPWQLAGRPSWSSKMQSSGVVFSRPLALELWSRAARLEAAGLAGRDWIRGLTIAPQRPPAPTLAKVRAFCAATDAPAWIVSPLWDGAPPPEQGLNAREWTPKAPYLQDLADAGGSRWLTARRYAVIPCVGG